MMLDILVWNFTMKIDYFFHIQHQDLVMMAVLGLTNGMNVTIAFESGRKIAQKVDAEMIGELSGLGSVKLIRRHIRPPCDID